jgi:hypothetical protein
MASISVLTVPIEQVKDGPYRNTLSPFKGIPRCFKLLENLFANLIDRAKAGHTLTIHVARVSDFYLILDGHICADVYRYIGSKEVAVILHEEIKTATEVLEAYIAFNFLRADWRDAVDLMPVLSNLSNLIGLDSTVKLMNDPESAIDLIRLQTARWWEFSSGEGVPVMDDIMDALPENLPSDDRKLRGDSHFGSVLIHTAEAHQKPPRRSRRAKVDDFDS